ncbi:alkaline phosphatase family protein [Myxococcota bacterium]|nr:alkaline phosphatase family protein [Myxococcota bacterium]
MPTLPSRALAQVLSLAPVLGCHVGPPAPTLPAPHRVVMVGIDGGDWRILDPFIEAGVAPHLARLRREGASAPLVIDSPKSPESWTSIASGHRPAQHGIVQDQLHTVGGGFQATNQDVKVHRIWDMATRHGRSALVMDFWACSPAYPILGVMLPRERGTTWPPDLESGADDWVPTKHAEHIERLGLAASDSGRARTLLEQQRFDLAILPYYGHDQGLHILYQEYALARDPDTLATLPADQAARARLGYEIIEETVRLADLWIELALQAAGPDGYVLLFSDHGHTAAVPATRRLALGRKVLDGGGGSIEEGPVDLSPLGHGQATGTVTSRPLYRQGEELRFPRLRVEGPDALAVAEHLLTTTTRDGQPLFQRTGDDTLEASAVLVAACRAVLGRHAEDAYSCFVNSGSHGIDDPGIFAVHGPGVVAGPMAVEVESVDVTPTALWLMGIPTADDLAGQPRTELLSTDRPVVRIPTYENGSMPWRQGGQGAPTDQTELMEWLKSMGYVE